MGVMSQLMGGMGAMARVGRAAEGLSEVFVANRTEGQALAHAAHQAALRQLGDEFALPRRGLFDRFVDGLNRLPRPMLALGTLGLFIYAMVDPAGFGARMEGLGFVPDPLWWLLGAIVGFYFGARELHYRRSGTPPRRATTPAHSAWHRDDRDGDGVVDAGGAPDAPNAALEELRQAAPSGDGALY